MLTFRTACQTPAALHRNKLPFPSTVQQKLRVRSLYSSYSSVYCATQYLLLQPHSQLVSNSTIQGKSINGCWRGKSSQSHKRSLSTCTHGQRFSRGRVWTIKNHQNSGSRIQLSDLKCSFTHRLSKIPCIWTISNSYRGHAHIRACHDLSGLCQIDNASFIASASQCSWKGRSWAASPASTGSHTRSPLPLRSPHLPQHGKTLKKHFQ